MSVIDPVLADVQKPTAQARGLPNAHYTDPVKFDEERDALFGKGWAGLAVASDVPEIGDARPITFLGIPVLMIRG
jgi:phenylpropionate dioxygenase-like ring-hydroxylating dioxygenase large terminal subunit